MLGAGRGDLPRAATGKGAGMSLLESQQRQVIEKLEREGVNLAGEVSALKSSLASQQKRHAAVVTKLQNDLTEARAAVKRLEHEIRQVRDSSYPLPSGVVG
jgi:chromosome segregation ATPase